VYSFNHIISTAVKKLFGFGPGIFAIGYTVGTGSVTSMIVAGSTHGMQLLWVLLLSCIFSGTLMFVYGNYTLITGETALYAFKKHLKYGKAIGILIIIGIAVGQWNSLMGLMGISSNIIFEVLTIYIPEIRSSKYEIVILIAFIVSLLFYSLLLVGKYSFFERVLVFFVSIMALSFFVSVFIVYPLPTDIVAGLIPKIPKVEGGTSLVAAFVGTTMAAATFLSRPLFLKGKGWGPNNLKEQKKDSIVASSLVFIITGALYYKSQQVTEVIDMVNTLEPIAGKFAQTLFFFGTLSAGLSSIFPILMIVPILISDYKSGELDTASRRFKKITAIACCFGLIVPIFGSNPIEMQIISQIFNVFVLPLVIGSIFVLVNSSKFREKYEVGIIVNSLLLSAFIFSVIISYNGVVALSKYF
jgi:manganese transport protein